MRLVSSVPVEITTAPSATTSPKNSEPTVNKKRFFKRTVFLQAICARLPPVVDCLIFFCFPASASENFAASTGVIFTIFLIAVDALKKVTAALKRTAAIKSQGLNAIIDEASPRPFKYIPDNNFGTTVTISTLPVTLPMRLPIIIIFHICR